MVQVNVRDSLKKKASTPLKDHHKSKVCAFWTYTIYMLIVQVDWQIICSMMHHLWRRSLYLLIGDFGKSQSKCKWFNI